jgi:hypothetical protein
LLHPVWRRVGGRTGGSERRARGETTGVSSQRSPEADKPIARSNAARQDGLGDYTSGRLVCTRPDPDIVGPPGAPPEGGRMSPTRPRAVRGCRPAATATDEVDVGQRVPAGDQEQLAADPASRCPHPRCARVRGRPCARPHAPRSSPRRPTAQEPPSRPRIILALGSGAAPGRPVGGRCKPAPTGPGKARRWPAPCGSAGA